MLRLDHRALARVLALCGGATAPVPFATVWYFLVYVSKLTMSTVDWKNKAIEKVALPCLRLAVHSRTRVSRGGCGCAGRVLERLQPATCRVQAKVATDMDKEATAMKEDPEGQVLTAFANARLPLIAFATPWH